MNNNSHLPEILAPVGNAEMLKAAVRNGADAVYLGGNDFNARMKADGFDDAALKEAVRYCHERFVRVYYTFNTLLYDDELKEAKRALLASIDAGVDAIIVQDLAVMSMIKDINSKVPVYASTQMTIHNLDGAIVAQKMGFDRIVLAREISASEIANVTKGVDIETEVFVHGAHCMSVSGQCKLSAMIGGRSGNRGMCAQPCRLPFSDGANDHALSLRDLSLIEHADELRTLGVTSLKIEGRLKRPEYVAATVKELRRALDGEGPDMELLTSVFSRSGFTDGYFTGTRDGSMFGVRTKENVISAKDVLSDIAQSIKDEPARWPLEMIFTMCKGEPALLAAHCGCSFNDTNDSEDIWVMVEGPVPESAVTAELTEERLHASMSKLGGTPYFLSNLTAELDSGLMMRSADLNEMRRAAVQEIAEKRIAIFENHRGKAGIDISLPYEKISCGSKIENRSKLRIRIRESIQLTPFMIEKADAVVIPTKIARELANGMLYKDKDKIIVELPPIMFDDRAEAMKETIGSLIDCGLRHFSAGNLYALEMLHAFGEEYGVCDIVLHGDSELNITNSQSLLSYLDLGFVDAVLSPEISKQRILAMNGLESTGILAYGYLPLMQLRNCPVKSNKKPNQNGRKTPKPDKNQGDKCGLTDRMGKRFNLTCSGGVTALHNCVPLYIGDKLHQFRDFPGFFTLYFTTESAKSCEAVVRKFLSGESLDGETTGGLYFR